MSKLYIFGIGGTGSRVLRSLTMMLASGVKFGADEIVPIIIDPDGSNADLTRTVQLMDDYRAVQKHLNFAGNNQNKFFKTKINRTLQNYTLHIKDTNDKTFKEFVGYSEMSKANKALTRMLFSDRNLNSSMEVGFKGNPNIGSVVLNQLAHSEEFDNFANSFAQGDKIFIISSIFGGTGASGFPLLLKTLRFDKKIPNFNLINQSEIGALTVLPYFKVKKDDNSEIDSSTFVSKAKSALAYYEKNIGTNGVNALYFLGDEVGGMYDNHEGGADQNNDAHLVEFLGATAIVNFSNEEFGNDTTSYLELGVKDLVGDEAVSFTKFHPELYNMLYKPMTQYMLMANALTYKADLYKDPVKFSSNKDHFQDFYTSRFFKGLVGLLEDYKVWLKEMKGNNRSLDLYNVDCDEKPFEVVVGIKPRSIVSMNSDYNLVTSRLNSAAGKCKSKEMQDKFLEMFYLATERLVSEKLKN